MEGVCEMRGFLSFILLRLISKKPMSGQEIRSEMQKRKGCRPSPGTIYPALKFLNEEGLIQEIKEGKKTKRYKLTERGRRELIIATRRFVTMFSDMKEEF